MRRPRSFEPREVGGFVLDRGANDMHFAGTETQSLQRLCFRAAADHERRNLAQRPALQLVQSARQRFVWHGLTYNAARQVFSSRQRQASQGGPAPDMDAIRLKFAQQAVQAPQGQWIERPRPIERVYRNAGVPEGRNPVALILQNADA